MYRQLKRFQHHSVNDLGLTMSISAQVGDKTEEVDLIPNGSNIELTDENKNLFIEKYVETRFRGNLGSNIQSFQQGIFEIVPQHYLDNFNSTELYLLLNGDENINVEEWKRHTTYTGFDPHDLTIQLFWRVSNCCLQCLILLVC